MKNNEEFLNVAGSIVVENQLDVDPDKIDLDDVLVKLIGLKRMKNLSKSDDSKKQLESLLKTMSSLALSDVTFFF